MHCSKFFHSQRHGGLTLSYSAFKRIWILQVLTTLTVFMGLLVQAQAQPVLRVTSIPEEAATEQIRKFTPMANYLSSQLGMKVVFSPVSDYPAAVEALVNKRVDLVWFGGFTFVQANLRSGENRPDCSARRRYTVPISFYCEDRFWHPELERHERKASFLWITEQHIRSPNAAQFFASSENQS